MSEVHEVTITLPSGALAGWPILIDALERAKDKTGLHMTFDGLIEQIRSQTQPRWTDGDVVQHQDANFTAQRARGEWWTTTGGTKRGGCGWASDEYVTNHVAEGRLIVLREQAAQ